MALVFSCLGLLLHRIIVDGTHNASTACHTLTWIPRAFGFGSPLVNARALPVSEKFVSASVRRGFARNERKAAAVEAGLEAVAISQALDTESI